MTKLKELVLRASFMENEMDKLQEQIAWVNSEHQKGNIILSPYKNAEELFRFLQDTRNN